MNKNLIKYKKVIISSELAPLIKYMTPVEDDRELLDDLSKNWDSLSLLSQLGNANVNMSEIKSDFLQLSSKLINNLATELLKKNVSEMNSKAQVAVDIVIRNLFERTADIGFLATDEDIRNFLRNNRTKYSHNYQNNLEAIRKRFLEYVDKYSVYFDIVLMNQHGDILVNLDEKNSIEKSYDKLIDEVLTTSDEYVESYRHHDFLPHHEKSLVYSFKVTQTNEPSSQPLGILSLCFKFEDEMQTIFKNLVNTQKKEVITLLDKSGKVIATSDKYHVPVDAEFEIILDERYKIITFGGRDYLAKSCETNGYQGFYGLGWYGHIMIPLEFAFEDIQNENFEISRELLLAILQNGKQFDEELKSIPLEAINIQEHLNRSIWNGNVSQSLSSNENKQFLKALLGEMKTTGENTKDIIGASIANLTKTILLGDSLFFADLIVDIMDRNLYERANDCRWWALTSDFREILDKDMISSDERAQMHNILRYINNLYTVYTNLFVYDKNGVVIAVSNEDESHLIGQKLTQEWVKETLKITDSSAYHVSGFEQSPLYGGNHTYIYNASIRSLADEQQVVGGIGIVFDAESQFETMIHESLPKKFDGAHNEDLFVILATEQKKVVSSNNKEFTIGSKLLLEDRYFQLKEGESLSEIIELDNKYYSLGIKCSKGYREYKREDDYKNNIYSLFFSYISDVEETKVVQESDTLLRTKNIDTSNDADSVDVASFMIGKQWLGVESEFVVESVSVKELKDTIKLDERHHFKGTLIHNDEVVSVIDIQQFINEKTTQEYKEVVIIKSPNGYLGLLVNALSDIPSISSKLIKPLQEGIIGNGTLVKSIIFPKDQLSKDVLSILSIEKIINALVQPEINRSFPRKLIA